MRLTTVFLASSLVLGSLAFAPAVTQQQDASGVGANVTPVSTVAYGNKFGKRTNYGTDSDFIEMSVNRVVNGQTVAETRTVGVFGSIGNGAFIMDVTDGEPVELGWYGCSLGQGDIQLFQRQEARGTATYLTFTDDGYTSDRVATSACTAWGNANGKFLGNNQQGTFIVDITDLKAPVNKGTLKLPQRPGLGTDSHDISFNATGTRAYSAALSQTVIIDTGYDVATKTYTKAPAVVTSFVDPAINVEHQAEMFSLKDSTTGLTRDFLIVEDEFAGAAAGTNCPSGGVHVYDVTGPLELAPVKLGAWYIDDVRATTGLASCTAHVFQVDAASKTMTMAFYNGGVRVVDLSGLIGLSLGGNGVGMKEIGFHRFTDSNSWSVKAPTVNVKEDGTISMWMYSNDINRGLDVYRFEGKRKAASGATSTWFSAEDALATFGNASITPSYTPFCLLKDGQAGFTAAA